LDQVGLLNERLLIPHATYTDRNPAVHGEDRGDLARLADGGASIIHCPLTSMRYGSTLDSFGAYKEAGINISLGTDSFPPDLVRGIDAGVQLAKILAGTNDAGDVAGYFDAARLGGAHALRRPDLGRLEPGAQADLVAFSLGRHPRRRPRRPAQNPSPQRHSPPSRAVCGGRENHHGRWHRSTA
jgi:8-oxoguanine deaminase